MGSTPWRRATGSVSVAMLEQAWAWCDGLHAENRVLARALAAAQRCVTDGAAAQACSAARQERCIVRLRAALVCELSLRAWAVPVAADSSNLDGSPE